MVEGFLRRGHCAPVDALFALCVLVAAAAPVAVRAQSSLSPGYAAGDAGLTPQERAGREIWFFATAFNDRFYTYTYPQRLGGAIDWFGILGAPSRKDLFQAWGAIPDPDCCIPGDPDCPARSLDETFGFPWCPGDDELLSFVGREGYRDPACDFEDAPFDISTPHGPVDRRQDACDLRFGTSTGALGLRKFPNPRFDAEKWRALNGSLASWDGYRNFLSEDEGEAASRTTRLFDGSVEPPFRIGMSCGACHIAYDPLNAPADPDNPEWENIDGLVGNQYSRVSQMMASGLSQHQLEWQLIANARPGIVDTSALPMDTVANPGTMNAIVNFARRPLSEHRVLKWRMASSCADGDADCWCEPEKPGKCWLRSEQTERVPNILKGGEDSIGFAEAVQRVYLNIGSCAEQCWVNHIPDMRSVDPRQRNYGQTPVDIGQCRRDCASFRAIEDRLGDMVAFLLAGRPSDLWRARGLAGPEELDRQLEAEFGAGAVERGRSVFARTCAGCHSSQFEPFDDLDFREVDRSDPTLRVDWLSSGLPVAASRVGTNPGRALHSNHMPSRVWDEYAARDLSERPVDADLPEMLKGGGRGYYRPVSLLSVWAHAPLMHNNAIGPEICGKPADPALDFYRSPYVDAEGKALEDPPACWPFDPSVDGRWKLFRASIEDLLYPERRTPKVFLTHEEIVVDVAPDLSIAGIASGFSLRVPKGTPAILLNSLRYKDLIQDIVLVGSDEGKLAAKYAGVLTADELGELADGLRRLRADLVAAAAHLTLDLSADESAFVQRFYSNLREPLENGGHLFGTDLPDPDKQALIAYLATL
jgi:hypothetical protein